jgi:hypothetical protein
VKKQILNIPLIICENDPTIVAVENNPTALSELFAAHHLRTPALTHHTKLSKTSNIKFFIVDSCLKGSVKKKYVIRKSIVSLAALELFGVEHRIST